MTSKPIFPSFPPSVSPSVSPSLSSSLPPFQTTMSTNIKPYLFGSSVKISSGICLKPEHKTSKLRRFLTNLQLRNKDAKNKRIKLYFSKFWQVAFNKTAPWPRYRARNSKEFLKDFFLLNVCERTYYIWYLWSIHFIGIIYNTSFHKRLIKKKFL